MDDINKSLKVQNNIIDYTVYMIANEIMDYAAYTSTSSLSNIRGGQEKIKSRIAQAYLENLRLKVS